MDTADSMGLITDPRRGDVEDDASSPTSRSLVALGGSMLVELSWMKLFVAWLLLLVFPSLALGTAPIVAVAWARSVMGQALAPVVGIWSVVVLGVILLAGWYGGRTLFRLAENGFWALNSVVIEPTYAVVREALRHLGEHLIPRAAYQARHATMRSAAAALAGLMVCGLALTVAVFAWRHSVWVSTLSDVMSMRRMIPAVMANSLFLVAGYVAAASLFWGIADATTPSPRDLDTSHQPHPGGRQWRIAHLSDLHTVGERYGFRIESGRAGPRGNDRLEQVLSRLESIHATRPLDAIVITGDLTDAGRSVEWAELLEALERHPRLFERMLVVPGNHDLNIVDGANPARVDLPTSPKRRLRQVRTLSMASAIQGRRVRVVESGRGTVGATLAEMVHPHLERISRFSDTGRPLLSRWWLDIWNQAFPMIVPPETDDGLGFVLINSNADTHFSFTNALGMVSVEQVKRMDVALRQYPRAFWVIALHHHLVEYPWRPHAFSERVGTALINSPWFVRHLRRFAGRAIVMHGHRHVDWLGQCAGLPIVSAPSQVMDPDLSCFYIHTLCRDPHGRLGLRPPERVVLNEVSTASNLPASGDGQDVPNETERAGARQE